MADLWNLVFYPIKSYVSLLGSMVFDGYDVLALIASALVVVVLFKALIGQFVLPHIFVHYYRPRDNRVHNEFNNFDGAFDSRRSDPSDKDIFGF